MAKNRGNETDEQSSDEEELFSYLRKINKVKQEETVADTDKNVDNKLGKISQVNQRNSLNTTDVKAIENSAIISDTATVISDNTVLDNDFHISDSNVTDIKLHRESQNDEDSNTYNAKEKCFGRLATENTESELEMQKNVHRTAGLKSERSLGNQNFESPSESDKYFLINEKDWFSLCAKLSTTEKQLYLKEQQDNFKTDLLKTDNPDMTDVSSRPKVESKSPCVKGKSMFGAYKQYSNVSKVPPKKGNLDETPNKASLQKVKMTSDIKKQNTCDKEQIVSLESEISGDSKTHSSPKVEIIYIRLEDGQIKYDVNKSPLANGANTKETNLQAVKKLDFSEYRQGQAFEHMQQGDESGTKYNMQTSNQENKSDSSNTFPDSNSDKSESYNSNTTVSTQYDDHGKEFKPGMQVRFVRINNKLTRVYETVKHSVVDEVLNSSFVDANNKNSEAVQCREYLGLEQSKDDDDTFDFDDSQLVAFPLNAVDPEMMNNDSLTQLTPSKLEMLNTSSKLEALTPNKGEIVTPNKIDQFSPSRHELFSPRKLELTSKFDTFSASHLDIFDDEIKKLSESNKSYHTAYSNENLQTEAPIVLKVTKTGELVQCKSNENSPVSNVQNQQSNMNNAKNILQNNSGNISKQRTFMKEGSSTNDEPVKIYNESNEHSNDLTNYISDTNQNSKESDKSCTSMDPSEEKKDTLSCSVSIQASFFDSDDEFIEREESLKFRNKKVRKHIFTEIEGENKIIYNAAKTTNYNIKGVRRQASKNKFIENKEKAAITSDTSSASKIIGIPGESDRKNCFSPTGSFISNLSTGNQSKPDIKNKRKGNRQIPHFYQDCNYKQVDFKDFEDFNHVKVSTIVKEIGKIDLKVERKEEEKNHSANKKTEEREKMFCTDKVEVKVRKKRANIDKKVKQSKVKDVKMKGSKKSNLEKFQKLKENERNEKSVGKTESDIKTDCQADDRSETTSTDEGQNKIDFLEKLFQIKLKDAAGDAREKKCYMSKSSSATVFQKESKKTITKRVSKSKGENESSFSVTSVSSQTKYPEQIKSTNKRHPRVKKSRKRTDEPLDNMIPCEKKEHISTAFQSDRKGKENEGEYKGSGEEKSTCRQNENVGKLHENPEKNIDFNSRNDTIQNFEKAKFLEVKKKRGRPRKQNVTISSKFQGIKGTVLPAYNKITGCKSSSCGGIIATGKSRTSKKDGELNNEQINRQKDKLSLCSENSCEKKNEATKLKKQKGREIFTEIIKKQNFNKAKSSDNIVSEQLGFAQKNEMGQDKIWKASKESPDERKKKNVCSKRTAVKTRKGNIKIKKNSFSTENESDLIQESGLTSSRIKGNKHLVETNLEVQIDDDTNMTNCDKSHSAHFEHVSSQDGIVSILATFQPLQEEVINNKPVNITKSLKRKKNESDDQSVRKRKRMKLLAEVGHSPFEESKKESDHTNKRNKSKVKARQFRQVNNHSLDEDQNEMPLDLSVPKKETKVKGISPQDIHKSSDGVSLKKLRDGKVLKKILSEKGASLKTLKSARKTYTSRKLKTATRRHEKESWKDMLDDGAFKFDFGEKMNKECKPVNVRHMVRNILKSVKGAEIIGDKHGKQKERKDMIPKHGKTSDANKKQRMTSEGEDAWLSDSGPSSSFPAFKFSRIIDSDEDTDHTKSPSKYLYTVDNPQNINLKTNSCKHEHKFDGCTLENMTSYSQELKQSKTTDESKCIELHHSPTKVTGMQTTSGTSTEEISLNMTKTNETKELEETSEESPEIKKNVDKLRTLLSKVIDKKVVRNLKFADTGRFSDTEH